MNGKNIIINLWGTTEAYIREQLIKHLEAAGLNYFNPVKPDYDPARDEPIEIGMKKNRDAIHIVIMGPERRGLLSILEGFDFAFKEGATAILLESSFTAKEVGAQRTTAAERAFINRMRDSLAKVYSGSTNSRVDTISLCARRASDFATYDELWTDESRKVWTKQRQEFLSSRYSHLLDLLSYPEAYYISDFCDDLPTLYLRGPLEEMFRTMCQAVMLAHMGVDFNVVADSKLIKDGKLNPRFVSKFYSGRRAEDWNRVFEYLPELLQGINPNIQVKL